MLLVWHEKSVEEGEKLCPVHRLIFTGISLRKVDKHRYNLLENLNSKLITIYLAYFSLSTKVIICLRYKRFNIPRMNKHKIIYTHIRLSPLKKFVDIFREGKCVPMHKLSESSKHSLIIIYKSDFEYFVYRWFACIQL